MLAKITAQAAYRIGPKWLRNSARFLSHDEIQELADSLAAVLATAELTGRASIRWRLEAKRGKLATFAEPANPSPFGTTPASGTTAAIVTRPPVAILSPLNALEYFRSLVPELGIDPRIFAETMRRQAFTMAVSTDVQMLDRVKGVIDMSMATGEGGTFEIQQILDGAGVSVRNPQYAEQIYRTNMMDAYNTGLDQEIKEPDVAEAFPIWRYDNPNDERTGEDHQPMIGNYYPNAAVFADVRGARPWNCRCGPTGIYVDDWVELQKNGAKVEESW